MTIVENSALSFTPYGWTCSCCD